MRLIFLDMDGVMNASHYSLFMSDKGLKDRDRLCPLAILTLNKLIEYTDAKVVITSTWRLGTTVPRLQELLDQSGFTGEVIGKTPNIGFNKRGQEIEHYVTHHKCDGFVVIEDDVYDCGEVIDHTVEILHQTDMRGLRDCHFNDCLEKLSLPNKWNLLPSVR